MSFVAIFTKVSRTDRQVCGRGRWAVRGKPAPSKNVCDFSVTQGRQKDYSYCAHTHTHILWNRLDLTSHNALQHERGRIVGREREWKSVWQPARAAWWDGSPWQHSRPSNLDCEEFVCCVCACVCVRYFLLSGCWMFFLEILAFFFSSVTLVMWPGASQPLAIYVTVFDQKDTPLSEFSLNLSFLLFAKMKMTKIIVLYIDYDIIWYYIIYVI